MFLREVEADPEAVATDFLNEDRDLQVRVLKEEGKSEGEERSSVSPC